MARNQLGTVESTRRSLCPRGPPNHDGSADLGTPVQLASRFAERPDGKTELVVRVRDRACRCQSNKKSKKSQVSSIILRVIPSSEMKRNTYSSCRDKRHQIHTWMGRTNQEKEIGQPQHSNREGNKKILTALKHIPVKDAFYLFLCPRAIGQLAVHDHFDSFLDTVLMRIFGMQKSDHHPCGLNHLRIAGMCVLSRLA